MHLSALDDRQHLPADGSDICISGHGHDLTFVATLGALGILASGNIVLAVLLMLGWL